MNHKSIMLTEISQTQQATYCMIPLIWHSGKGRIIGVENTSMFAWGGRGDCPQRGTKELRVAIKVFYILTVVVIK